MPARPRSFRALACQRAVSLVEVVVSLGILTIVAVSVLSVTFMIRSTAEQAVYQNTALTLAQGYLEQLRSLDYTSLAAAASSTSNPLSLINAAGNAVSDESGNAMNAGDWARERVFLDINAAGANIQPLTFRFRPVLTNMTGTAIGVEITVFFETTYDWGVRRTYNGALRTVRSSVPTY
ncbi:hypothetical protein Verru16b_02457 [Lacunisphaera limnophila]|uniref:Uncharacterized protein n=1 Tax=Lacunisphaera limnophila TaxID=1838286 RepID=A0A1D8AWY2_9BACT|nr:hypothetical protein [Lacunisphaera limnophila]AOS45376.1 hypothetical protein Verru16b_02457 [Lacunisphaera limnophila]